MSMSDPLGDMLTRIRNGQKAHKAVIQSPASRIRANVLEVLQREGYIRGFKHEEVRPGVAELKIELKMPNCPSARRGTAKHASTTRTDTINLFFQRDRVDGIGLADISATPDKASEDRSIVGLVSSWFILLSPPASLRTTPPARELTLRVREDTLRPVPRMPR